MEFHPIRLCQGFEAAWAVEPDPRELMQHLHAEIVHLPRQVHGAEITFADEAGEAVADGLLTRTPGLMIGIRTADCLPILLAHPGSGIAGAVHAGWRGLAEGILENLSGILEAEGVPTAECALFMGPCIGPCCYPVGPDVGTHFGRHFSGGVLDLRGYALEELTARGFSPEKIHMDSRCTCCTPALPSHRRKPGGGRILTCIAVKKGDK
jgi:polyphenol oxidase